MDRNFKKLLCSIAAVLLLTGCNSGGGETTAPTELLPQQTTAPAATLPKGEGVEECKEPIETEHVQTTAPQETSTQPPENTTEPDADPTEPDADPTEPSEENKNTTPPVHTTDPTSPTEPADPTVPPETTQPQADGRDPADLTYEEYLAMSPSEQQSHYEQFPNLEAYIAWHNAALAVYEENQGSIEVTGGIDIGDFMDP